MPTILLTNKYNEEVLNIVRKELPAGFDLISLKSVTKENLISSIPKAEYLLASGRLSIDKETIELATRLKMIQRTGVGTDTLDIKTLNDKGIPVYVNPGINSISVAEHTILLILAALRRLPMVDSKVKAGIWEKNDFGLECRSLYHKVVGIIGIGNIGKNVAKMLQPFGVKVLYYDPLPLTETEEQNLNIQFCSFSTLLKQTDILSLHCPLTPQTKGMIGKNELDSMKPGSFIVNTGRGPLINEKSLYDALTSGHLKGAALDVFSQEPPNKDHPLLKLENVISTPHVGGLTLETFSQMIKDGFENIRQFEMGQLNLIEDKKYDDLNYPKIHP